MGILKDLVGEDFGIRGANRWWRGVVHDSLVVDDAQDYFYWNSEGVCGGPIEYLMHVRGMSYRQAIEYINSRSKEFSIFYSIDYNSSRLDDKEKFINPALVDIFYNNCIENDKSYWSKRGITDESITAFRLGFTGKFFTIPLYVNDEFRNFQLRSDTPTKVIKLYYSNLSDGGYLFNDFVLRIIRPKILYITEGPTDCIRLFQEGVPCVSHTLGSEGWNDKWNHLFDPFNIIYIIYDNDLAGFSGALKLSKKLGYSRCRIYNFFDFEEKFDVIDFFNSGNSADDFIKLTEYNYLTPAELDGKIRALKAKNRG